MLADTVDRLAGVVPPENTLVVTSRELENPVRDALPELPAECVYAEPVGRNTAPCIGWAANEILDRDPDGVMAVLPADHVVSPTATFRRALARGFALAERDRCLVTFGVKPDTPATGYGYVQGGKAVAGVDGAFSVRAFHEKPSLAKARGYLRRGGFYWNAGIFAWRADVVASEIGRLLPDLAAGLQRMEARRRRGRIARRVLDEVYPRLPSISIDYGVLERARRVSVLEADFSWNDIGSWDSVGDLWPRDGEGNASRDRLIVEDAAGNIVAAGGKPVALLGVRDLVVVDAGDSLLVCRRDRCQDVRKIVARLEDAELESLL